MGWDCCSRGRCSIILVTLTALAGVWALSGCVGGYLIRKVGAVERIGLGIAGLLLFYAGSIQDILGCLILGLIVVVQIARKRAERQSIAVET